MKLSFIYDKRQKDFVTNWPDSPPDGHLVNNFFHQEGEFMQELEKRGYDLKAIRFEITKKEPKK